MKISITMIAAFNLDWLRGRFNGLRYGQAFYDHFKLHQCKSHAVLCNRLYNATSRKEAEKMIEAITDYGN